MSASPPGSPPAPPAPAGQPAPPAPAPPAPAASPPPAAPPAPAAKAPPPAAPPPKADPPPAEPAWTKERTKSAEKAVLTRYGIESEEQLQQRLTKLKELEDAQKTEQEKLQEQAAEGTRLKEQLAGYASTQMATLTPEQQAAVKAVAGEDPGRQLNAIETLRPTWAAPPAAAAADPAAGTQPGQPAAKPAPARPPVAPVTTTHTQPAPDGSAAPAESHLAKYEAIKEYNAVEAGIYRREHSAAIEQERKAKAAGG